MMRITIFLALLLPFRGVNTFAQRPEARNFLTMTYDDHHKQILMFGGVGKKGIVDDLWALKGTEWKKISDGGPKKVGSAFTYDAHRKAVVLFGGAGPDMLSDETWEWDGKKWNQINVSGPSPRMHTMGAYDYKSKTVLIFGGYGINNGITLSDTWAYDGRSWKQMDTDGPKDCLPHGMVYDEVNHRVILITLASKGDPADNMRRKNDMWEWTGNSWKKLAYATPSTTTRSLQALASFSPDGNRGGIILFDGDDINNTMGKTWIFSKGQWTGASLPGPSAPRIAHGMIYDKAGKRTILFGGTDRINNLNDLWAWDGKQWNDLTAQWLKTHKDDYEALKTYATSLNNRGNYGKAEEVYKKILAKNPTDVQALLEAGLLMYKLKRPEEGGAYLSQAMQGGELISKSDYVNLGRSLYYLHFYKESAMYYGEGLKLQATGGDYYNQACSYALAGEKDKAFESLEQAVAHGFNKKQQFENDKDLESLKADIKWNILSDKLK